MNQTIELNKFIDIDATHRLRIIHLEDGSFWVKYSDRDNDKKYGATAEGWLEVPVYQAIPAECRFPIKREQNDN